MRQMPPKEEIHRKVAASVRESGIAGADAAKVAHEVVREILQAPEADDWEAQVPGRVESAQRRLHDARLFRQGFTLDQIEGFRLHYSR
jgi:hypothetical protein